MEPAGSTRSIDAPFDRSQVIGIRRDTSSASRSGWIVIECRTSRCGGGVGGGIEGSVITVIQKGPVVIVGPSLGGLECAAEIVGKSCSGAEGVHKGDGGGPSAGIGGKPAEPATVVSFPVPSAASVVTYSLKGKDHSAVHAALNSTLINPSTGKNVWGLTVVEVGYRYEYSQVPGGAGIRIVSVNGTMKATTSLPNWVDFNSAEQCLQDNWKKMLTALTIHENGHLELFKSYESRFREKLLAAGSIVGTLQALNQLLTKIHGEVMADIMSDQIKYDLDTSDGVSQGVVFSPCGVN